MTSLVYPIAQDRFIVRLPHAPSDGIDPDAPPPRRKSPKHGSPFDVFSVLTSFPTLLEHPNLTLDVVMVIEEEIRVPYQGKRWRRRDWVSVDRRLLEVVETHTIEGMGDLFAILDRVCRGASRRGTSPRDALVRRVGWRLLLYAKRDRARSAGRTDGSCFIARATDARPPKRPAGRKSRPLGDNP